MIKMLVEHFNLKLELYQNMAHDLGNSSIDPVRKCREFFDTIEELLFFQLSSGIAHLQGGFLRASSSVSFTSPLRFHDFHLLTRHPVPLSKAGNIGRVFTAEVWFWCLVTYGVLAGIQCTAGSVYQALAPQLLARKMRGLDVLLKTFAGISESFAPWFHNFSAGT